MQLKALPGTFYRAGRLQPPQLSAKAQERLHLLRAWEALRAKGLAGVECSRVLQVPRATIYRWRSRWRCTGPGGLEDGSRAPKRHRGPTWSSQLSQAVLELRELHGWGKDKLVPLLGRAGWHVSTSMVGRILKKLRESGKLVEAPLRDPWQRPRQFKRPYGIRKPKDYTVYAPGDLVQLDTLDLRPLPGVVLKQFTARDVVCRWDVIEAYSVATADTAPDFLTALKERLPFPVRATQVDGGSEFMAQFEAACKESGVHLYVLPRLATSCRHVPQSSTATLSALRGPIRSPPQADGNATKGIWICLPFAQRSAPGSASTTPSDPIRPWRNSPQQSIFFNATRSWPPPDLSHMCWTSTHLCKPTYGTSKLQVAKGPPCY